MTNWIPPQFRERLSLVHEQGSRLLIAYGLKPESLAAALAVEEHRWYWKPHEVGLVLIAESHTHTSEQDLAVQVIIPNEVSLPNNEPPPSQFVGLIYCLGYGEPTLLRPPQKSRRNTVQFWNLFGKVAEQGRQPTKSAGNDLMKRLEWKVETLRQLSQRGIWLMDASLHAIYKPGGERLPLDVKSELHRQWWTGYGQHVIEHLGRPNVWVIGKITHEVLSAMPDWRWTNQWIYQPNARNVDPETNWPRLLAMANAARQA